MLFGIGILKNQKIKDASLLLRIFKKYIDAHDFNFSSSDEMNRLFWNYYRLKENVQNKNFWTANAADLSSNEICMDILVEFYLKLNKELHEQLNKSEEVQIRQIINRFYEQLELTSNFSLKESSRFEFQLGRLGLHG